MSALRKFKIMKTLITIILTVYMNVILLGQSNDPIQDLYSTDNAVVWEAVEQIETDQIVEAIPVIINLISQKNPITQIRFLECLHTLNYEDLIDIVYDFIDRAETFSEFDPPFDPLKAKISATLLLFYLNDFSTYDYVFEYINRSKPMVAAEAIYLLPFIYEYVPTSSNDAYNELLYGYLNSPDGSDVKYFCLENLNKLNPSDFNADLINQFSQSDIFENRIQALRLLCQNRVQGLNQILINQLSNEEEGSIRIKIVDSLLTLYGFPSELKAVIDHLPNETNSTAHSIMSFEITNFIPPRPTVATADMIENLISYNDELYAYNWITESPTYLSFSRLIEKVRAAYNSKELEDLCFNLNQIITNAEGLRGGPLLTEEGYKFLYYHTTYIKENVESELGTCEERDK